MNIDPEKIETAKGVLVKIQDHLQTVSRMRAAWHTATEDEEKFAHAIAAAGDIDYTNEKAIRRATEMQVRLDLCRKAKAAREKAMLDACKSLREMIRPAGDLVANMLSVILANRLETITASLQPFYADRQSAEEAARRTHCYVDGQVAVFRFMGMDSEFLGQPFEQFPGYHEGSILLVAAEAIETVLIEAAKKVPDWLRFLPARSPFNPTGQPTSAGRPVAPLKFPSREDAVGQTVDVATNADAQTPAAQEAEA